MKPRPKAWNVYIMVGNLKIYLRKRMTTMEIIKWLEDNCKMENSDYFMRGSGTEVFCETREV